MGRTKSTMNKSIVKKDESKKKALNKVKGKNKVLQMCKGIAKKNKKPGQANVGRRCKKGTRVNLDIKHN